MSLRIRLIALLTILFLVSILLSLGNALLNAQREIMQELDSIESLTTQLLSLALDEAEFRFDSIESPASFNRLLQLKGMRHIDVRVESETRDYPQLNRDPYADLGVPRWFIRLVRPADGQLIRSFRQDNGDVVIFTTNAADELLDAWYELTNTLLIRLVTILFFIVVMSWFINRWLQEVSAISSVLSGVERGDFSRKIPGLTLPEFNVIGEKVNQLAAVLGTRTTENERLNRKSLAVQENERRRLAQELHDSLGQSVSAIKAMAVSIRQRTEAVDQASAESARSIEQIAHDAYQSVRSIMGRLRPAVLDELGLAPALRQMVDEWNDAHEDSFCRLRIDGDFTGLHDDQQINVYRIVQESLTNIAKHARAENVDILLSGNEIISLLIRDDGHGFDARSIEKGMGLTGIIERVQILNGEINIGTRPGRGVSIEIEFPRMTRRRRRSSDRR